LDFPGDWFAVDSAEYFVSYGTMRTMSSRTLTATSYLALGLLAREGPSTPYDLERHVRATLGNFWSFPHTLLYSEPPRLAAMGLLTETREADGRRRRVFTITTAGVAALDAWLDQPSDAPTELRDPGLLQLFFADLASPEARLRLAEEQLAIHRAKLAAYEEDERLEYRPGGAPKGERTIEHWRGETLRMGLLYEGAAVDFWEGIVSRTRATAEGR
jgi:PadR family transcriptional regulator AphA